MSGHGDEPELTKAVPLESDATGVIPVASDPETGEKKKYEYDPHLDPQL